MPSFESQEEYSFHIPKAAQKSFCTFEMQAVVRQYRGFACNQNFMDLIKGVILLSYFKGHKTPSGHLQLFFKLFTWTFPLFVGSQFKVNHNNKMLFQNKTKSGAPTLDLALM